MNTLDQISSTENIKLSWTNSIRISQFLKLEDGIDYDSLIKPYTIQILNENEELLREYNNFKDGTKNTSLIHVAIQKPPALRRCYMFANTRKIYNKIVDTMTYEFTFPFEENVKSYIEKNNKLGYFKNLKIKVISEDNDESNDVLINVSYSEIILNNITDIFMKIYRNIENTGIKLKFNKNNFLNNNIESILIEPLDNDSKEKFKCIFIDKIKEKWLSIIQNESSISIPFPNNYTIKNDSQFSFKLYYLNQAQSDMLNVFKNINDSDEAILQLISENFSKQSFDLIDTPSEEEEYKVFYQNFLYLFNNESYNNISWPSDFTLINGIKYKKYFPLAKDNLNNETYLINRIINPESSAITVIQDENISNDTVGFKYKDLNNNINYNDISSDLTYQKNTNIKSIEIKTVLEENGLTSIFLEVITNFIDTSSFKILNISNNLSFVQRSFTNIDNKNYVTLLFKLNYDYINDSFTDLLKSQLLFNKEFISFDFDIG
jgi:hypothetical protein